MKICVSLEQRFERTPDGSVWTQFGGTFSFWQRYLDVFESVEVIGRVQPVDRVPSNYKQADGKRVHFIDLPCYIGPEQYLRNAVKIDRIVRATIPIAEAVLLRVPGQVSNVVYRYLRKGLHPYGVEVVGDPYDMFISGSVDHPLSFFFRWWGTRQLKKQCEEAVAASYVTETTLQQRYPNPNYSTHYSSIDIGVEAYVPSPKSTFGNGNVFKIIFVGTLAQLYKAPDVLIEAVFRCVRSGFKINLAIIGDGKFRLQLESLVERLELRDAVRFLGQLPGGEAVRIEMLHADLFVLPSHAEGLPRAMIEAMACGLPCIGTNVGGIPELLSGEDLVPPGQVQALADKIGEVLANPERMRTMAARNLEKAKGFRREILDQRRREFFQHLRDETKIWLPQRETRP